MDEKSVVLKQKIIASFSRAAKEYDTACRVQKRVAKRLLELLESFTQNHITEKLPILELGCGTGVLTTLLAKKFAEHTIIASDICPSMLNCCRANVIHPTVEYAQIDMESPVFHEKYALLTSSFVLHWCENVKKSLCVFMQALEKKGVLALSLPLASSFPEWKKACRETGVAYTARELPIQEDLFSFIKKTWPNTKIVQEQESVTYASSRDFFSNMKKTGASVTAKKQLSFSDIRKLIKFWDTMDNQGVVSTWDIGYIFIQKV